MIIKDQNIVIKLSKRNKEYYYNKGYIFNDKTKDIVVKVTDLPPNSSYYVDTICDYCGKKYKIRYCHYVNIVLNGIIRKSACLNCGKEKTKESNMLQYGTQSTNSLETVKQKKREIFALSYEEVKKEFDKKNYLLLSDKYVNNATKMEYICLRHFDKGIQTISYQKIKQRNQGCVYCFKERKHSAGENNHNWKGGISTLNNMLRDRIRPWIFDSLKEYKFKCAITNDKKSLEVHHPINFSDLVQMSFEKSKVLKRKRINELTDEEMSLLITTCIDLHYEYGLGIPLHKKVHRLFHDLYGKKNNTHEQMLEFIGRYHAGEFGEVV